MITKTSPSGAAASLSWFQIFVVGSFLGLLGCGILFFANGRTAGDINSLLARLSETENQTKSVRIHDLFYHSVDGAAQADRSPLSQAGPAEDADLVALPWSSRAVSNNSFSSFKGRSCVAQIGTLCHNSGSDKCSWKGGGCGFSNVEMWSLSSMFRNQTFVFHGDSTMRETFSVWSYYCCPWAAPVLKADTNMSSRMVISRIHHNVSLKSFFRFDYLFDHLLEPLPQVENETVDAVVVGLGMYHAKAIVTNETNATSLLDLRSKINNVIKLVCDVHKAKVGFYVGGWMECGAMKHHKAKAVRQNYRVCYLSTQTLRAVNKMVHDALLTQSERPDGCFVHYIQPLRCHGQKHFCTGDGVHARSNGNYGNSKFQLLFNSVKTVYQNAPSHLLPQHLRILSGSDASSTAG